MRENAFEQDKKKRRLKGWSACQQLGPVPEASWCVVSAGAACGFGIRPKISRPAAAEVSSRTREKKTSATQGKMDTMVKWLELTSFVAKIWVKDENNDRDIQFAHSSKETTKSPSLNYFQEY